MKPNIRKIPVTVVPESSTTNHGEIRKAFGIPSSNGSFRKEEKYIKLNAIHNTELKHNY